MDVLTPELAILAVSIILLFVHIGLQGMLATKERGSDWNAGPRDGEPKPLGVYAGRAKRASDNFRETFPAYVALALALTVTGRSGGVGEIGAWLWLVARIVYIPLYLLGIAYVRSLVWLVSLLGLALMLIRFLVN